MFTNLITLLNIKILFLKYEQCKAKTYKNIQIQKLQSTVSIQQQIGLLYYVLSSTMTSFVKKTNKTNEMDSYLFFGDFHR